ncbi:MAG TPA: MBL fold metallo-hydrolase, partial [Roseivirga sp.]
GVAQDAGFPQAGNPGEFEAIKLDQREALFTVSLGLVDPKNNKRYLFEATPDFKEQLQLMDQVSKTNQYPFDGIFLTHAHIGHYTGLMHLGREVMGTMATPVYAMPKMKSFIESNGPWSQLVELENIDIKALNDSTRIQLADRIFVTPFTVPHRDEYSETVGYQIEIYEQSIVFIPDIDKWEKWDVDIREVVKQNDLILIDASFYKDGELKGRDMSLIPHPFTTESMELFKYLSPLDKAKVYFIHANHTNPILDRTSDEFSEVIKAGFQVAEQGQRFQF